jgi:hypothetical protein
VKNLNEVIRALECCIEKEDDDCIGNCPYYGEADCLGKVMVDALQQLREYQANKAERVSDTDADN